MNTIATDEPGTARPLELRISARPENLTLARLALAGVGGIARAPEEVIADLKLAVTEACTNAIQHAYAGGEGDDEIVVRYLADGGALSIEIDDSGSGFSDGSTPPDAVDGESGQGLGLMIIREVTDDVRIESGPHGSRVRFVRRFTPER
jgi:serine/threonine-protein kinase RsbW